MAKRKNYLFGAAILAAGGIFAKFLGIFYKIPLDTIIGKEGLGLYALVYPIYNTFLSISIIGLPVAVSKMVSERVSLGNYKNAYQVFNVALISLTFMGLSASLLMFAGANFFIRFLEWNPDAYYSIIALSFAPLFVAISSAYKGFFQGMQLMSFSSVSQVIEQIARIAAGISLAFILTQRYGVAYGAAGATFGATAGGIVSLIFLSIAFIVFKNKQRYLLANQKIYANEKSTRILKTLLWLSLPVAFGGIVNTVMDLINTATVSACLHKTGLLDSQITILFGILESNVQTLVNVPLIIGSALAVSLVPSISESYLKRDTLKMIEKTSLAIRTGFFISMPSAVGLSVLAEPILNLLFSKSSEGGQMLSYLAYVVIFTTAMSSLQGILQGAGRFYKPLKNLLIGACIKLLLNIILVSNPAFGIFGAIYSSVIATFVIFILNYLDVKKFIGIGHIGFGIFKTIITTAVMGIFAKISFPVLESFFGSEIGVILCILFCSIIYLWLNYLLKTITKEELRAIKG